MEEEKKASKSKKCTLGWNWGYYDLDDKAFTFKVNNQEWFNIPYKYISLASANGKNEVAVELVTDQKDLERADVLTECRFFVPNPDADEEDVNTEEKKKVQEDVDDQDNGEKGKTPAQIVSNRIVEKAGIGEYAGHVIATVPDCPMLIPRGKYDLEIYETFIKFHGRTHDYKILHKDINRAFLLPKPDSNHIFYIIALNSPIRQGQTQHNYLVLQLGKETEANIKVNLSPKEIESRYQELTPTLEGVLYDVLSRLLKCILNITIIVPSGFKSSDSKEAVSWSVKAQEGYMYPLRKSLLFLHKPVAYIRHDDIQHTEFARVSEFAAHSSRSFDLTVVTKKADYITFSGLEKAEYSVLLEYFKAKNVKVKTVGEDQAIEEEDEADVDEAGEDYDEEEDEDFVVEGNEAADEDSGEGEMVDEVDPAE